jgi:hypothetical protein
MSPREVQGLQALAENHGGSLTINPETGLPEAGFLDKLLPAIIGFALAPMTAGTSLAFLGATPFASALTVGGLQTLRTGDIGKGISAGLGAYGGAGLQASLAGAGANALSGEATSLAANEAGKLAGEEAVRVGMQQGLSEEAINQLRMQAIDEAGSATARIATDATPFEKLSAGASQATSNPTAMGQFAKDNFKNIAYAAGPILADQAVKSNLPQTTTKPGMVTPYSFFGGQYIPGQAFQATPTRAAGGGLMGMDDGGYSPGMLDFTQKSEPVVRMDEGGIAGYAAGGAPSTDPAIARILADAARLRSAPASNAPAQAVAIPGVVDTSLPGQYVTDPATGKAVALSAYSPGFDPSNAITQTYLGELAAKGGTDTTSQMFNQMGASQAQKDANAAAFKIEEDRLKALDIAAGRLPASGVNQGLAGLNKNQNLLTNQNLTNQNQNVNAGLTAIPADASYTNRFFAERGLGFDPIDKAIDNFFAEYTDDLALLTPKQQEDAMRDALRTERMNEADVIKATGKTIAQHIQQKTGNIDTVLSSALPGGVSGGGNTVINANGTVTTRPDIPGIGDGFTGIKDVRDTYVEGGGSLGYTSPTFDSLKAVEEKYPLRGAAKKSYDYLMGREDYDPIPYTKDGQISKSYNESVMKLPKASSSKMYIFQNGKFVPNPDYAIPTYDKEGKKSLALTNQDVINYVKSPEFSNDDTFVSWMTANNLSPEQVAAATGMPIADVYKKIKKAKPVEKEKTVETPVEQAREGGLMAMARGGMTQQFDLGGYSDGGRLLRGPGDGVSDSIPATIGNKRPARLADGEFVVPARIVSELGNGSTEAGARKLYAMMDRVQKARRGTVGKGRVAKNSRSDKYLPA